MKTLPLRPVKAMLYVLLAMAPVSSVLAQGQILFGNSIPGVTRAPVYGPDPSNPFQPLQGNTLVGYPPGNMIYGGALLAGTGYTMALFVQEAGIYVEVARSDFRTGTASGFAISKNVTVPNHPPGSSVTVVVRAWDNQGGTVTSWAQALTATTAIGQSASFTIPELGGIRSLDGHVYATPGTVGLRSFNIYQTGGASIVAQPQDVIVPAGASAQMRVEVASDIDAPSFQWQRDGADISSATNATLTFTNIQYADAGGYSAIVTVPSLTLTSRVARLTVQPMIVGIEHFYIEDWGADAIRLSYDSTANHPVRVEVRSTLRDTWINMGQFVNSNVRAYFFDIGPTNDMRIYRLSIDP